MTQLGKFAQWPLSLPATCSSATHSLSLPLPSLISFSVSLSTYRSIFLSPSLSHSHSHTHTNTHTCVCAYCMHREIVTLSNKVNENWMCLYSYLGRRLYLCCLNHSDDNCWGTLPPGDTPYSTRQWHHWLSHTYQILWMFRNYISHPTTVCLLQWFNKLVMSVQIMLLLHWVW